MDAATLSNLLAWSLQALALLLVGGPLPWLLRLHDPAARHAYWRVLLLACLLLPVLQPWQAPAAAAAVGGSDLALLTGAEAGAGPAAGITTTVVGTLQSARWRLALTLLLVAGVLTRLGWLAAGLLRLRRLRRDSGRDGVEQVPEAADAPCPCRYAEGVSQPVTFGLRRPVVLLPLALAGQPVALRRAVIEHELWHVRRRDWLWVVAEESVRAALWFHPGITWLISQIQASREEVVDELTVLSTNARRDYLQALLAFADEPPLFPAAPFARRRHLFHRMLLISKEVAMSSRRIVGTCAAMAAVVVACAAWSASTFPLLAAPAAGQTRDFRPNQARPATQAEIDLRASLTRSPELAGYLQLAKLQEARNAVAEAEATLTEASIALPDQTAAQMALAQLYGRTGRFDSAVQIVEQAAVAAPADPKAQHLVATFYEEKVRKDTALDAETRARYLAAGIAAEDRGLAIDPDYVDGLIVKNVLLRQQAAGEADPTTKAQLIAQADQLRNRALALRQAETGTNVMMRQPAGAPGMPPAAPSPGGELREKTRTSPFEGVTVDGSMPIRIGGNVKTPTKVHDVRPIYPQEAQDARVQGVVILEAVIDGAGSVREAKVLRSIPVLDQAALDAVQQWQFVPTLLNGNPVPVIMTVTVNFTLQ